jgi:hypothetical protein
VALFCFASVVFAAGLALCCFDAGFAEGFFEEEEAPPACCLAAWFRSCSALALRLCSRIVLLCLGMVRLDGMRCDMRRLGDANALARNNRGACRMIPAMQVLKRNSEAIRDGDKRFAAARAIDLVCEAGA